MNEINETNDLNEKLKKDLEQLKEMDKNDVAELLTGYQKTLVKSVERYMDELQNITNLCPAIIPVYETGIIIAEADRLDDECDMLGIIGQSAGVKKIVSGLWKNIPQIMAEAAEENGFVKKGAE